MVFLTACSENANQVDTGQGKDFVGQKVEASESKSEAFLPESSEGTIDNSKAENFQEQESNSVVQEDGTIRDGKYFNTQLGFSFDIPEHWMEYIVIKSGYWEEEALHSIDFYYIANDDVEQLLFSILVYNHIIDESQWENPVWNYIGTSNGKTYVHVIAGEPSETILEERNIEHFEFVQKLINEELLDVLDTFNIL